MFREGLLVVISGPSGVGKGTILKLVKQANSNISYSVSATTRKPREGEIDGVNYFFKTVDEFKDMIENDELIEWVEYCDNFYGTPKKYVKDRLTAGYDVVLEIEVEGAISIKNRFPESVSIFIVPPTFEELRNRIVGRGTEKEEAIQKRLSKAKKELQLVDKYDYIVVNNNIEDAVKDMNNIFASEKLKYSRNKNILNQIGFYR